MSHPYGWLSLLPPIVAIVLAIATRRIVLSLVVGIFAGALLMAEGNPLLATYHTWETHLWRTLIDSGKLRVFSFTILMGAMIGVITRSGGMRGLIELVEPYASNRRRGQLATWVMGLLIFFDDYANTILLGSTLRPITDRLKISREKLAYLVDSTAAPVAGLAPLSTWVAVEIDYIASGLSSLPTDPSTEGLSAFGLFLSSIPYRFYIITALLLVPITAWLGRDIGPMIGAERRAIEGEQEEGRQESETGSPDPTNAASPQTEAGVDVKSSWYNAVLPIALTLGLVVYFIYDTGSEGASSSAAQSALQSVETIVDEDDSLDITQFQTVIDEVDVAAQSRRVGKTRTAIEALANSVATAAGSDQDRMLERFRPKLGLRDILGEADSSLALQYGALAGLALACLLPLISRQVAVDDLLTAAMSGARVVLPAVAILWTASAMSNMTRDTSVDGEDTSTPYEFKDHRLYTADYLTRVLTGDSIASDEVNDTASGDTASGDTASGEAGDGEVNKPSSVVVSLATLPTIVFVLAAIVAFCTGTSWGTMGILVPTVIPIAHALISKEGATEMANDPILLSSIGGVLAGAVFGDHCSPISDTTVLSSQSSGCDHLAHVWTQMPYALLAASASTFLGTLPVGYGVSVWILLPLQIATLIVLMRLFGRKAEVGTP